MNKTKRDGFSFLNSYYQVYKRLGKAEKVIFMDTLLEIQFLESTIADAKFDNAMTDMGFHSIIHSLQSTIDGYLLQARKHDGFIGVHIGGTIGGTQEEKEKEKEKEKEEVQVKEEYPPSLNLKAFNQWCEYKGSRYGKQGKILSSNKLSKYTHKQQQEMVDSSIMNGYKGLFEPKNTSKAVSSIDLSEFGFKGEAV